MSTLSDIGVSVFLVVHYVDSRIVLMIGILRWMQIYLQRILPGSFFQERFGDFLSYFSELPGGGAMHAIAEGYMIAGLCGTIVVSIVIEIILGRSMAAMRVWQKRGHAYFGLKFLFPWILLIRGGWYQFFAFFKSIEIMGILFFILALCRFHRGCITSV